MTKKIPFLILLLLFISSCKKNEDITETRYFDKIEITNGNLSGWDILSPPDLYIQYGENSYSFETSTLFDIDSGDLPASWVFATDRVITDENWLLKVLDKDDLNADEVLFETNFQGLEKTKSGNPFYISNSEWTIAIHWKTK